MRSILSRPSASMPLVVLCALTLSGCLGGPGGAAPDSPSLPTGEGLGDPTVSPLPGDVEMDTGPLMHPHDYWGTRTDVLVFDDTLTLEQDAFRGGEFGCRSIGHREFGLEDDGDDVDASPTAPPVNPDSERADTVFAGANGILAVLVAKDPNMVGDLYLRWKPADLNHYKPENSCGQKLEVGEGLLIPVAPRAADPPHQIAVSRWSFFLIAAQEQGEDYAPSVGLGDVHLTLTAHKGYDPTLDPPHPDLYHGKPTYDLGCAKAQDVPQQTVVWATNPARKSDLPIHQPPARALRGIQLEYGRIVPMLTEKVLITFQYTYTGSVPGTTAELYYFGGDTNRYAPVPHEGDVYQVDDPDGLKADPPYEPESFWRFMLVPRPSTGVQRIPDPQDADGGSYEFSVADFMGSYEICAVAHRKPGAILS